MEITALLPPRGSPTAEHRHYECRQNGRNLTADVAECPECGSGVAVYTF
jgi:ribosomal protein S27AE